MKGTTLDELQTTLQKIGWSIKGAYPNRYIFDHEGKKTEFRVMDDRVEPRGLNNHIVTCFYFEGSETKLLDTGDSVALGTEKCFALFMNHTIAQTK